MMEYCYESLASRKNVISLTDHQSLLELDLDESFKFLREAMKNYSSQQESAEDLEIDKYWANFAKIEKTLDLQAQLLDGVDVFLRDLVEKANIIQSIFINDFVQLSSLLVSDCTLEKINREMQKSPNLHEFLVSAPSAEVLSRYQD